MHIEFEEQGPDRNAGHASALRGEAFFCLDLFTS
jgi:hypothetical protein